MKNSKNIYLLAAFLLVAFNQNAFCSNHLLKCDADCTVEAKKALSEARSFNDRDLLHTYVTDDSLPDIENLKRLQESADEGNEIAINILLRAYRLGGYGLDPKDPEVQAKGSELVRHFANKGSEQGIFNLSKMLLSGRFGFDVGDKEASEKVLDELKVYAEKGSAVAVERVLSVYTGKGSLATNLVDANLAKVWSERFSDKNDSAKDFLRSLKYVSK